VDLTLAELRSWAEEPVTAQVLEWIQDERNEKIRDLLDAGTVDFEIGTLTLQATLMRLGVIDGLNWFTKLREELTAKEEAKKEQIANGNSNGARKKKGGERSQGAREKSPYED